MTARLTKLAILAALAGSAMFMAACADTAALNRDNQEADDFGHAVREDLAAQIVNPEPVYRGPPPPTSGARAALANNAYRGDTVKQPVAISTQTTVGGSQ